MIISTFGVRHSCLLHNLARVLPTGSAAPAWRSTWRTPTVTQNCPSVSAISQRFLSRGQSRNDEGVQQRTVHGSMKASFDEARIRETPGHMVYHGQEHTRRHRRGLGVANIGLLEVPGGLMLTSYKCEAAKDLGAGLGQNE